MPAFPLPFILRFLLAVAAAGAISTAAPAQRPDVVYVPTSHETVSRMLSLAAVRPNDYVIDLGSGDGRIVIAAAQRGARALGVDINPERIREANANARKAGVTNRVTFRQQNMFNTGLSEATVITMYLLPELNLRLRPRLLALRPGTRVVSHDFHMGNWKANRSDGNVYLWIVPARVAGRWQLQDGEQRITLNLKQQFQELSGTATFDGRTVPLRNARLRGVDVEFAIDVGGQPRLFRGRVVGNRIEGTSGQWQATRS